MTATLFVVHRRASNAYIWQWFFDVAGCLDRCFVVDIYSTLLFKKKNLGTFAAVAEVT